MAITSTATFSSLGNYFSGICRSLILCGYNLTCKGKWGIFKWLVSKKTNFKVCYPVMLVYQSIPLFFLLLLAVDAKFRNAESKYILWSLISLNWKKLIFLYAVLSHLPSEIIIFSTIEKCLIEVIHQNPCWRSVLWKFTFFKSRLGWDFAYGKISLC